MSTRLARPKRAKPLKAEKAAPTPAERTRWFATACALVALAASGVGLFFDVAPQYRPDPQENVGADLTLVAIEPRVPLRDWLERVDPRHVQEHAQEVFGRPPSRSELAQVGELLYVRTQVDGHKHKDVTLAYQVYDGKTQTPVAIPLLPDMERLQRIRLDAPSDRSVQLLWMPSLEGEDDVFIRVQLSSEHGLLAVTDSKRLHDGKLTH